MITIGGQGDNTGQEGQQQQSGILPAVLRDKPRVSTVVPPARPQQVDCEHLRGKFIFMSYFYSLWVRHLVDLTWLMLLQSPALLLLQTMVSLVVLE